MTTTGHNFSFSANRARISRRGWLTLPAMLVLAGSLDRSASSAQSEADAPGRPAWMLQRMPALPLTSGAPPPFLIYADLAGQTAAAGLVVPPDRDDRAAFRAWSDLVAPSLEQSWRRSMLLDRGWSERFGFDLLQIDQLAGYDSASVVITLLRGRFDTDILIETWLRAGYDRIETDHGAVFSQPAGTPPGERPALAGNAMDHAVALDGDLIAFAGGAEPLTAMLALAAGTGSSLADDGPPRQLLGQISHGLLSATIFAGSYLQAMPLPVAAGAGAPTPLPDDLPPASLVLVGRAITPAADGASPAPSPAPAQPRLVILLAMARPEAAIDAATVISDRLARGRIAPTAPGEAAVPFAALFSQPTVAAVAGEPVVVISLALNPELAARDVRYLLDRKLLSFLAMQ